ncbi:hypothetical protein [Bacillus cereus group sp. BfR-BA-01352]|nr:hypothetical protein [Bacillus cereus group sp. BfR-BA-01352]
MEHCWSVCGCMNKQSLFKDCLFENIKMYSWIILVIFRDNANFFGEITF